MTLLRSMMQAAGLAARRTRSLATVTDKPIRPLLDLEAVKKTMPPDHKATVGQFDTFVLPNRVSGSRGNMQLGKELVDSWRRNGILQIAMDNEQKAMYEDAQAAGKAFFSKPFNEKQACIDSQSYAGYIASGEEITNGVADYSETFTLLRDSPLSDPRVLAKWPCWGRVPWPDHDMQVAMERYKDCVGQSAEKLLALVEMGLDVPQNSLLRYTEDGWHSMRVLRYPAVNNTNGKGKQGRGIGSHTDYGLLVFLSQNDVGGLFIRPPHEAEKYANWQKSTAGAKEDDDGWVYVPPVQDVFSVLPGDMMQYMTNSYLPSTLHKVGLNTRERFVFGYFHEPNFQVICTPLPGYNNGQEPQEGIHYGTHFTDMFMRNYPDRITTQRIVRENRYAKLAEPALRTLPDLLWHERPSHLTLW